VRYLKHKNILLISPQSWDHVFISKHHYAEELAAQGNIVYFLNPPTEDRGHYHHHVTVQQHDTINNLFIVSWHPFFPRAIRFHFYRVYTCFVALQARMIVKKIGCNLDLVWSFDFNLFPNLNAFGARFNIFHPVDPLTSAEQISIARSAHLIISVSESILNNFNASLYNQKKMLLGHGLSREFKELAEVEVQNTVPSSKNRKVGYFGNLDRQIIDVEMWLKIVSSNVDVEFHFWGPYSKASALYVQLSVFENTVFYGSVDKQTLAGALNEIDCFLLIYNYHHSESDRSNAHKILEYLSTGKVVVSNWIEAYQDKVDLVRNPGKENDAGIYTLLQETLINLDVYNGATLMKKRKQFALKHSYESNLQRVDERILRAVI